MSVTSALERIHRWAEQHDPEFVALLQPGLTRQEIDALASGLPFALAEEVYELYQWHNGQEYGEYGPSYGQFRFGLCKNGQDRFLPLPEALHEWESYLHESYADEAKTMNPVAAAEGGWPSSDPAVLEAGGWLPLFGMDSDFKASLGVQPGEATSPIAYVPHDGYSAVFYSSLTALLEYNADVYDSQAQRTDEQGRDYFDYTIVSALKRRHFPNEVAQAEEAYRLKCHLPAKRVAGALEHPTGGEFAQYDLARQLAVSGSLQAEAATERYLVWLLGDAERAKQITQTLIRSPYRIMYGSEKQPILVRNFVYSFLP